MGAVCNIGEHDTLTVDFVSMGPQGSGNDFAIDDISLRKLSMVPESEFIKTVNRTVIWEGEAITDTITFTNPGPVEVTNITVIDVLSKHPEVIVDYSITVNINGGSPYSQVLVWRMKFSCRAFRPMHRLASPIPY
ncbi:MAG: DUF11 domain-containing protein [Lachnospiraceae bacterium]|nr:DUF11 domain-containing protein [Lachnospiraceae bacterium]